MTYENTNEIAKNYDPKVVEKKLYDLWLKEGCFKPRKGKTKDYFSIVIPPPNVTGNLHVGHGVFVTLQDAMIRYHRMKGDETVWVPGTDHAGIATQVVVEKKINKESSKSRHDFSRDEFVKKIWDWVKIYKENILNQLKSLGGSFDWSRERFTLDDDFSKAVNKVFVDLYNKGLIYRGDYIVNWCSRCSTVLSDLEAIAQEEPSKLYNIRYFVKAADKSIMISTTRPETMLGDVAVAVHPADKRYKDMHDKILILPVINREIPIIVDERVDMNFGTGAVKITPAHDMLDYEIGKDHGLDCISVIDKNGKMNKTTGKFAGLDVLQARQNIIEYLDNIGNLEGITDCVSSIRKCERCGTTVEPMISKQWFVKTKPLAEKSIEAVKEGKTKFIPERFEKEYINWMENIKDWCISRQLWWGHQIPVYYMKKGDIVVSETPPKGIEGKDWTRDEDVLDTWFSSSIWPFVVFGWPEKTEDFKKFYPTTVLETGRDILFFWVCRMMMMGIEMTGETPFKYVYLHGLVRDEFNRKMSKSLGNTIEPYELQDAYGTDTTRLTLAIGNSPGNDLSVSYTKAEGYRNFVNKLWNASRFIRLNLESIRKYDDIKKDILKNYKNLTFSQKWILSRLSSIVSEVTDSFEKFSFGEVCNTLYEFTWHEFCDWFLEITKVDKNKYTDLILQYGILTIIKLWHPIIPFVTEEIWSYFKQDKMLIISDWPEYIKEFKNDEIEKDFSILIDIVRNIRNIRNERKVQAGKFIDAYFVPEEKEELIKEFSDVMKRLARIENLYIVKQTPKLDKKVTLIIYPYEIYLPLEKMIDIEQEKELLSAKKAELEKQIRLIDTKLNNPGFINNAPEELVEEQVKRKEERLIMLDKVDKQLEGL